MQQEVALALAPKEPQAALALKQCPWEKLWCFVVAAITAATALAPLAGVYLHGLAGDLAASHSGDGLIASDVLAQLPRALVNLRRRQTGAAAK